MQQNGGIYMAAVTKHESTHPGDSSMVALLSGWVQQGAQTFFATQRILLDLAMRQNASLMKALREQVSDPHHSPTAILSEMAGTGMTNFLEGQKVLLELGREQSKILMDGVQERVGDCPRRIAAINLLRSSVETFIHMQEEFLKIAGKQTHTWIEAAKTGKPYQPEALVGLAREGMENFVKTQKRFLDVLAEETSNAIGGKRTNGARKMKKTELAEIARKATASFIEAQKRLVDVAGRQMDANVKTVGKTLDLVQPLAFPRLGELAHEAVKSYVDAQRALMDVIVRPSNGHQPAAKARRPPAKRAGRVGRVVRKAPETAAIA
jgi:hypothetical protein